MKGAFKTLTIMAALLLIPPAIAQQSSNVLQTMKSTVIPASDAVFAVGNSAPKTPQEWSAVESGAAKLIDAAKSLTAQAPAAAGANWGKYSKAMSDAAATALKAAQARNVDAVLDAGDVLYTSCEECHRQYLKK